MSVLVYHPTTTTLKAVQIPDEHVDLVKSTIAEGHGLSLIKSGLKLTAKQIAGVFTEIEYHNLKTTFFSGGEGYQTFLELGKALHDKKSIEKWKKYSHVEEA